MVLLEPPALAPDELSPVRSTYASHSWHHLLAAAIVARALAGVDRGHEPSAAALVEKAFQAYRGKASVGTMEMTIHRPSWERTQVLKAWTRGEKDTLVTLLDPPRDRGNGTLKLGDEMWIYNPKINRVIKLPPSMMSQAWMGSDFTNNDLAKSDSLLTEYDHRIVGTERSDGQVVYEIDSTPRPGAPIVWGHQQLLIRADGAFLKETFYDQDGKPVKVLTFTAIRPEAGLPFAHVLTMTPVDEPGRYTKISYREVRILDSLPDRVFTESTLRHPPAESF